MAVQSYWDQANRRLVIEGFIEGSFFMNGGLPGLIMQEIATEIAHRFVEEHFAEIAALIEPRAVANLSIAEAAAAIRETLERKIPASVLEIHRETQTTRFRGIFG